MTNRRALVFVASFAPLLLTLWQPTRTEAAAPGPEDAAREALRFLKEDRTEDFAKAMHPDSLVQLKTAMLRILDEASAVGKANEVLALFDGVKTPNELKSLNDAAFMTAYLRGSTKLIPGLKENLRKMSMQVIGHVPEGREKAYVVYRSSKTDSPTGIAPLKVIGLRRSGAGWGMLLGDDIEVLLLMLKQKVGGQDALPQFNLAASQIELLGPIREGRDKLHQVFRLTTPINGSTFSKVSVLSATTSDPEWRVMQGGNKAELITLIEQSVGIKPVPPPAGKTAAPTTPQPLDGRR